MKGPTRLDQAEITAAAQELAIQVAAASEGAPTAAMVADAVMSLEQKAKLKRQLIREDLLEKIHDMLRRMDQPHTEYFPVKDDVLTRVYPTAPHSAVRNYAVAFATLFKEYRLEAGEATDRPEATTRILDVVKDDHERELLRKAIDKAIEDERKALLDGRLPD